MAESDDYHSALDLDTELPTTEMNGSSEALTEAAQPSAESTTKEEPDLCKYIPTSWELKEIRGEYQLQFKVSFSNLEKNKDLVVAKNNTRPIVVDTYKGEKVRQQICKDGYLVCRADNHEQAVAMLQKMIPVYYSCRQGAYQVDPRTIKNTGEPSAKKIKVNGTSTKKHKSSEKEKSKKEKKKSKKEKKKSKKSKKKSKKSKKKEESSSDDSSSSSEDDDTRGEGEARDEDDDDDSGISLGSSDTSSSGDSDSDDDEE